MTTRSRTGEYGSDDAALTVDEEATPNLATPDLTFDDELAEESAVTREQLAVWLGDEAEVPSVSRVASTSTKAVSRGPQSTAKAGPEATPATGPTNRPAVFRRGEEASDEVPTTAKAVRGEAPTSAKAGTGPRITVARAHQPSRDPSGETPRGEAPPTARPVTGAAPVLSRPREEAAGDAPPTKPVTGARPAVVRATQPSLGARGEAASGVPTTAKAGTGASPSVIGMHQAAFGTRSEVASFDAPPTAKAGARLAAVGPPAPSELTKQPAILRAEPSKRPAGTGTSAALVRGATAAAAVKPVTGVSRAVERGNGQSGLRPGLPTGLQPAQPPKTTDFIDAPRKPATGAFASVTQRDEPVLKGDPRIDAAALQREVRSRALGGGTVRAEAKQAAAPRAPPVGNPTDTFVKQKMKEAEINLPDFDFDFPDDEQ